MRGKLINPWQCPPDPMQCRLLHLENLPPNCTWRELFPFFSSIQIEHQNIFGHQALIQFYSPGQAYAFYESFHNKLMIGGYPITITFSPLTQLILTSESPTRTAPSRVICIQVMKLRVCLGIQDIYDECSQFGIVEKIICFEKTGKFALVQMSTVEQASLVLVNLSNSPRHLPAFQFRVQYSKNQDIVIKFNNSKSFDFTQPDAQVQFARMRESTAGERPFFVIDETNEINSIFDFWRPVHFDPTFSPIIGVTGYDEKTINCDILHNLFCQYGPVKRIKIPFNRRRFAFIMFANSFYARLALTFLNNCPFEGKHLIIDFPMHPDINQQGDSNEQYFKDYSNEGEDLEFDDYACLSFPTNCVKLKNSDLNFFIQNLNINLAENAFLNHQNNTILFPTVDEATRFICQMNTMFVNNKQFFFVFCSND
ncbi:hypothetical protein TRFO_07149 [Tritrichomonas foetus]|uniref:RRM domain-containing protein n=1 Tax=Tritrichomonas foetus TaxID=1144522 RepID=A0A1J4JV59_9EUKA|nr:hypothetical protein TRFO_07149 [Tritrichomonas foetus]|eukprot:OHT02328.1 hypothetical protein TRFO_07149 [Tritrichomonas foetus]